MESLVAESKCPYFPGDGYYKTAAPIIIRVETGGKLKVACPYLTSGFVGLRNGEREMKSGACARENAYEDAADYVQCKVIENLS